MENKITKKENLKNIEKLIKEHKNAIEKLEFIKKYNETAPETKQIIICS